MLAAVNDTPYKIVLLLHILVSIIAFSPVIAHPVQTAQAKTAPPEVRSRMLGFMVDNGKKVYAPAVVLCGLLGMALVGLSGKGYRFADGWVSAAFVGWLAINGVLHAFLLPAERRFAAGDDSAEARITLWGIVITVLLVVMLVLMVWKPGSGG